MTRKQIILLFFIQVFVGSILTGQVSSDNSTSAVEPAEEVNTTWLAPVITDEMTVDPEQNRQWRLGQYKYAAKPKNMWEIGIHGGHFLIDGDVDRKIFGGYGGGLHFRKALNYIISLRFDGYYGKTSGIEAQPWKHKAFGGGLVEQNNEFNGWEPYNGSNPEADSWFPSYQTTYYYGAVQLVFNVGNISKKRSFHRIR